MKVRNHLVVMVKTPVPGRVKTRLSRDVGLIAATAFARVNAARLLRTLARDRRWTCWLAVTPARDFCKQGPWPSRLGRLAQGRGDLGARMFRPMEILPPGPVVVVGTDVPGIRPAHVAAAFRSLGRCDAVFGPAKDGGYWLVGIKRRPRLLNIFRNVRWSSKHALQDTIANVPEGWRMGLLETLEDVDEGAAYARWRRRR